MIEKVTQVERNWAGCKDQQRLQMRCTVRGCCHTPGEGPNQGDIRGERTGWLSWDQQAIEVKQGAGDEVEALPGEGQEEL